MNKIFGLLFLIAAFPFYGIAGESEPQLAKYDLSLVWIADKAIKKEPAYIFTANNAVGFLSVSDSKKIY